MSKTNENNTANTEGLRVELKQDNLTLLEVIFLASIGIYTSKVAENDVKFIDHGGDVIPNGYVAMLLALITA